MTIQNLGFLTLGDTSGSIPNTDINGLDQRDQYVFRTGNVRAAVSLTTRADGAPTVQGADVNLRLFQDLNENGRLDSPDAQNGFGVGFESSESININLNRGQYIALVDSGTFLSGFQQRIPYSFRVARAASGSANPLTEPEISVGQISQDLQKRNTVSDTDTADNFAFTLDANDRLDIKVKELGNKAGDVNIRVVQDLNSNGTVDNNEVVARGSSSQNGNLDSLSGFKGAGDYILQVCQSKGNTRFQVNFEHSPITA